MPKKSRDEMKREQHIERDRIKREATAQRRRKTAGSAKPKKTRTPKPTPRRNLEPLPKTKDDYSAKLSSIKSDLNSLSLRIKNLPQSVNQLDNNINEINTRLQNLRNNRYHSQSYLEKMSIDLEKKWSNLSPNIQSYSLEQSNQLLQRKSNLESRINRAGSLDEIIQYGIILSDLNREYTSVENSLRDQLDGFQSQYQTLDDDLRTADETVSNLMNSSIGWKINEHPVLAVKIHDMTNDKHGVLTLTNFRILFEETREEVLRRNLLFATEKKTVREVILDQPIGSIDEIEKGRVGFFKGAGLFIKFKPQTGLGELKIDTSGDEDNKIIYFYNYIISGDAEKELEPMEEGLEDNMPIVCPTCSAPYREEILKGQTSVKCIYCGSVIML